MKLIIFGALVALTPSLLVLTWLLWNAEGPRSSMPTARSIKNRSNRTGPFKVPEIAGSFSLDYVEDEPQRHPEQ
jgi:hypothetical protein